MQINDVFTAVGTVGFPIAVTIFILVRLENNIKEMTESITKLTLSVNSLIAMQSQKHSNSKGNNEDEE